MTEQDQSKEANEISRKDFLKKGSLAAVGLALGSNLELNKNQSKALAQSSNVLKEYGKEELRLLNDKPINAEALPHLLDDEVTPESRLFVRNNGLVPEIAKSKDISNWTLTIDGEVNQPLTLSMKELKQFKQYTYHLILECGGNGRAGYFPPAKGNQWTYGAVGCPLWTGVRLKDVLEKAGVKAGAVYIGYYGHDIHLSKNPEKVVISRGVPIEKALDEMTLIAFEMNGKPLPALHGYPARLICPGYPGSTSGKWLKRITVVNKIHDGPKMTGYAYRVPKYPVAPGTKVPKEDMQIIEEMPVKSLITSPKSDHKLRGKTLNCQGFAWTGKGKITSVDVSSDFGKTWVKANLKEPRNPFAWQRWEATLNFPTKGYYEIWSRATDSNGQMQPMVVPGWNPKGYLNNAMPRISVHVE